MVEEETKEEEIAVEPTDDELLEDVEVSEEVSAEELVVEAADEDE